MHLGGDTFVSKQKALVADFSGHAMIRFDPKFSVTFNPESNYMLNQSSEHLIKWVDKPSDQ